MNTDYKYHYRKILYGKNTNIYRKKNCTIEYFRYKNKIYNVKDYKSIRFNKKKGGVLDETINNSHSGKNSDVYEIINNIHAIIQNNYPLLYEVFINDAFIDDDNISNNHHTVISDKLNNINIEYCNFVDNKGDYFKIVNNINIIRKNLIRYNIVMNDCFMCMNKKATHIFKDCCHKCMCNECSLIATNCPFCDNVNSVVNIKPIPIFDSSTIIIDDTDDKNTNYEYNYVKIKMELENDDENVKSFIQPIKYTDNKENIVKKVSLRKRLINEKKSILKNIPSSIIEFKNLLQYNYPNIYQLFINNKSNNIYNNIIKENEYKYFINKNKKNNREKYLIYSNVLSKLRNRTENLAIADDDCSICNNEKATYTFVCGHKCMCEKCIDGILYDDEGELLSFYKCPICNFSGVVDNDIAYEIIDVSSNNTNKNDKMLKIIMGV